MSELVYGVGTKAWHPFSGCDETLGCAKHCWAKRTCHRLASAHSPDVRAQHQGLVEWDEKSKEFRWSGVVRLDERHINDPWHWRKSYRGCVGYHGDIALLPNLDVARVFSVMHQASRHTYFLLTKRISVLAELLLAAKNWEGWVTHNGVPPLGYWRGQRDGPEPGTVIGANDRWPPKNVLIGISARTQAELDERAPHLMKLAAAGWRTWLSLEPLLEEVNVEPYLGHKTMCARCGWVPGEGMARYLEIHGDTAICIRCQDRLPNPHLEFVVVGGESGPGADPMNPDWVCSLRDQCAAVNVPWNFKQWGEWAPVRPVGNMEYPHYDFGENGPRVWLVGKKLAGRTLDGGTWDGRPE